MLIHNKNNKKINKIVNNKIRIKIKKINKIKIRMINKVVAMKIKMKMISQERMGIKTKKNRMRIKRMIKIKNYPLFLSHKEHLLPNLSLLHYSAKFPIYLVQLIILLELSIPQQHQVFLEDHILIMLLNKLPINQDYKILKFLNLQLNPEL